MLLKSMMAGLAVAVIAAGTATAAECTLPPEAQAGKTVSNLCKSCHVFEADKPSRPTGPNLHDVYGRKAGTRTDFTKYSEGMQGASAAGVVWTDDKISEYVADPKAFLVKVNGKEVKHAMIYQLKDEQKRKDVIAFLKAIKDKPECN
ncbi:MAG: c-type cytochrome [Telmatospirillum sp.]|nr:c-type cytochrome [Telmatospirillum sp.]